MNLQPRTEQITTQKEVLKTTQGLIWKVGGLTLDASKFTVGEYVKAGTPVVLPNDNQLAVPWTAEATGIPYVTTHDVKIVEGSNPIVGAFEEAYFDKKKVTLPADFINAAGGRYKVR